MFESEQSIAIQSLRQVRQIEQCIPPCGGWWLSPFDTWERCPNCPNKGHPEAEDESDISEFSGGLSEDKWSE
jgi:hypothetical protein